MEKPTAVYEKLDSATLQFRVVVIEAGNWTDEISCTLRKTSPSSNITYEALSYVWGDPKNTKEIRLDNQSYQVTLNLESALRHLRDQDKARTMWIDALCINQTDVEERSSQVQYMREIYEHSSMTIVWLGNSTSQTELAFNFIQNYVDNMPEDEDDHIDNVSELATRISGDPASFQKLDSVSNEILMQSWWSRSWVLQEAAVSKELYFRCGIYELAWWSMQSFATALLVVLDVILPNTPFPKQKLYEVQRIATMRKIVRGNYNVPLAYLVAWNRWRHATDTRDKVFSMISLSRAVPDSNPIVNYAASLTQLHVFLRLVELSIPTSGLDIICMSQPSKNPTWPSWVPDWETYSTQTWAQNSAAGQKFDFPLIVGFSDPEAACMTDTNQPADQFKSSDFKASSTEIPKCDISIEPPILRARGLYVDRVHKLSKTCRWKEPGWHIEDIMSWGAMISSRFDSAKSLNVNGKEFHAEDITEWFHEIRKRQNFIANALKDSEAGSYTSAWWTSEYVSKGESQSDPKGTSAYIGGGTITEAYLRTLLTDRVTTGTRIDVHISLILSLKDDPESSPSDEEPFLDDEKQGFLIPSYYNRAMEQSVSNRRLMISSKGYIGLAPHESQHDDIICILFGCSVPIVLRKVDEHYVYIGECYVHGIMDGQAIDQMRKGLFNEQEFVIK